MNEGTPIIIKKKKAHGHGGHHGGSWKVAYADFVTAMMAFFMVMWIMGLSEASKSQIQGYFNDPLGFAKNQPKTRSIIHVPGMPYPKAGTARSDGDSDVKSEREMVRALQREVEDAISEGNDPSIKKLRAAVDVEMTQDGLQIEFLENNGEVFFELGSAVIRPVAKELILRIAPILAKSGHKMFIDGHTDSRPLNQPNYDNWDLSGDRAGAMRRILKAGGVGNAQILAVRANADTHLRKPDDPYHFTNRRVSVLLPYKSKDGKGADLPKDIVDSEIQGVFRRPVDLAP